MEHVLSPVLFLQSSSGVKEHAAETSPTLMIFITVISMRSALRGFVSSTFLSSGWPAEWACERTHDPCRRASIVEPVHIS